MRTLRGIVALILLGLLVVALRVPRHPFVETIPARDSGVYLYIGSQILDGKLPYRDAWDNKPPAIYYVDALGLYLARGAAWGVSILQVLAFIPAAWLGFALLDRAFGRLPAIFGSVTWILGSTLVLRTGNLTEEFALPLQFWALYLFLLSEQQGRLAWRGVIIGVTLGLAFLLRPNLVAVHLAVLVYLLWPGTPARRGRSRWLDAAVICGAATGVVLLVAMYFAARGALTDGLDAAFRFNAVYHTSTPRQMFGSILGGLDRLAPSGLPIVALAAWLARVLGYGRDAPPASRAVIDVALIGLPLGLLLASLGKTGIGYAHYYIAWLPIFLVLAGVFAYDSAQGLASTTLRRLWRWNVSASSLWVLSLALAMGFLPLAERVRGARDADAQTRLHALAIELIRRTSAASDSVLVWGFEPSVNFVARRTSPTRFVYQLPLYVDGYQSPRMIDEFFRDLTATKPILIIDASSSSDDVTPPIDPVKRATWRGGARIRVPSEMDRVFEYVTSNYHPAGELRDGPASWTVYRDRRRPTSP